MLNEPDIPGIDKERLEKMRKASGSVKSDDRLVMLFYFLIRDHLTPGSLEKAMQQVEDMGDDEALFTNGWLANYCKNLRNRIFGLKK